MIALKLVDISARMRDFDPAIKSVAGSFRIAGYDFEDLCQEGRLAVAKALASYDSAKAGGSGAAWVRSVVRNKLIDIKRSEARRIQPSLFCSTMEELENLSERSPAGIARFRETTTPKQAQILLDLGSGMRQAEIAKERGVSRQAVHRMLIRIRRKIEVCWI